MGGVEDHTPPQEQTPCGPGGGMERGVGQGGFKGTSKFPWQTTRKMGVGAGRRAPQDPRDTLS